jgi:hypothetical protein
MTSPSPLIYINAFPGTGKLTIARALISLLSSSKPTSAPVLLDNHTLIDPVPAKYTRDHPNYAQERRRVRKKALREYVLCEQPPDGREEEDGLGSWVMCTGPSSIPYFHTRLPGRQTWFVAHWRAISNALLTRKLNCRSTQPADIDVAEEYRAAAQRAERVFIPVVLMCDVDENARRLQSEERGQSGTTKLTDVESLRQMRQSYELYQFEVAEELVLDVTNMSAEDAAVRIRGWAIKVSGAQSSQQRGQDNVRTATESLLY